MLSKSGHDALARSGAVMTARTIVTVVGARPQFVKVAPVSRELTQHSEIREYLIHTGQHYDARMSDVFFKELGIRAADHNLGLGTGTHGQMTGRMLASIETILLDVKPALVLVYGDTNSTLAGALAAVKLHIPVAHVEAGLRSFNLRMPEEVNRVVTDRISSLLFAPSQVAQENLLKEGVPLSHIATVGDVMFDVAKSLTPLARRQSTIRASLQLLPKQYILSTIHRAENTDDAQRLRTIITALDAIARSVSVVLPLHPRTRQALDRDGLTPKHITVIDPIGYLDMLALESEAQLIVTDSGGVQKEAYFQGVPCVTLRDETEWVELVTSGWNTLVPPSDPEIIVSAIRRGLGSLGNGDTTIYGDGTASRKIVDRLLQALALSDGLS